MMDIKLQKKLDTASGPMLLDVDFSLKEGEFASIQGPSGAGKSSIARMLAGLMVPEKGRISHSNTLWLDTEQKISLPPQQRPMALLFQKPALFPNMTVARNLSFALAKHEKPSLLEEMQEVMELGALWNKRPQQLSGGQQQRVALARTLVQSPKVLLLDEPLSAQDPKMRKKLQDFILQKHRELGCTTLLISHDESDIASLAATQFILSEGKLVSKNKVQNTHASQHWGTILSMETIQDHIKLVLELSQGLATLEIPKALGQDLRVGDQFSLTPQFKTMQEGKS